MNVRSIDAFWDRKTRNDINYNFDFLSKSHRIIQTQLNDLVLQEGNSPLEVRQARGGHQVLADRLNSTDQQLAQRPTKSYVDNNLNSIKSDLAQKATKGEIGLSDINKNNFRLDETYISDSLRKQIAGDAPIHSIPAPRSVTSGMLAYKSVTPQVTDFFELNTEKNMFDGNYLNAYITGVPGEQTLSDANSKVAEIKIEPNTSYSIVMTDDVTPLLKVASSTGKMEIGEHFDGALNEGAVGTKNEYLVTTGENDQYLYVSTVYVNSPPPRLLKIVKSNEIVAIRDDEEYPYEPKGVSIYSKEEIDNKKWTPKNTTFIDNVRHSLFDGNFIEGKYLSSGSAPFVLINSSYYYMVALEVKPNTTYTILKEETEKEDGYYYFKFATSSKPLDELLSLNNYTMDGISDGDTNNPRERFVITTGSNDRSLLINVSKYTQPYTEVLEGEHSTFKDNGYGGRYVLKDIGINPGDIIGEMPEITTVKDKIHLKKISQNEIRILYPSNTGNYIGYTFALRDSSRIQLYTWMLTDIGVYNSSKEKIHTLTEGDNDGVLRIEGEHDYIGGAHGDELMNNLYIYVDGIEFSLQNDLEGYYDSIEFLIDSDIYHADSEEQALTKVKSVTFDKTGVHYKSRWKALKTLSLRHLRGTLLSIYKKSNGVDLITSYRNNIDILPNAVPEVKTKEVLSSDSKMDNITFSGGLVTANIWAIDRGGEEDGKVGMVADFDTRLKAYIDSYTGYTVQPDEIIYDEHKFLITTR